MKKQQGQIIVEFLLASSVLASFFAAFIFISQLSLIRQMALEAAWAGARLQAEGITDAALLNDAATSALPRRFLFGSVDWTVTHGRFLDTPSSRFYHLAETKIRGTATTSLFRRTGTDEFSINEHAVIYQREEAP